MTPKGQGVIRGRRDLLHDPKGQSDLYGLFDPKGDGIVWGRRDLLYDPKCHSDPCGRFDLVYGPKRWRGH